jgi:hypothetical protein
MPQLDLSDAFLEPTFQDQFYVLRRSDTTDVHGKTQISTVTFSANGVVTINGDQDLDRGPDEQHAAKTITVITRFNIRGATKGYQPDIIRWHGDNFLVTAVEDYSTWGLGWYQISASEQDFVGLAQPWEQNLS